MTSHFATELVRENFRIRDYIKLGIAGLVGLPFAMATYDLLDEDLGAAIISALTTAGLVWMALRVVIRRMDSVKALQLAERFDDIHEESVPLNKLGDVLQMAEPLRSINRLIRKRFLHNVSIDYARNLLVFHVPNRHVQSASVVIVECPNCGAESTVREGRTGRCQYCDSELLP